MEGIARLVRQIRGWWPEVRIVLCADSGFARDALMSWCEAHTVDDVFGLAKSARLLQQVAAELDEAQRRPRTQPERVFKDFTYSLCESVSNEV